MRIFEAEIYYFFNLKRGERINFLKEKLYCNKFGVKIYYYLFLK